MATWLLSTPEGNSVLCTFAVDPTEALYISIVLFLFGDTIANDELVMAGYTMNPLIVDPLARGCEYGRTIEEGGTSYEFQKSQRINGYGS